MKNCKKFISLALAGCLIAPALQSCRDDMAEINDAPKMVGVATPTQLFNAAVWEFDANSYGTWFFLAQGFSYTSQLGIPSGGITATVIKEGAVGQGQASLTLLRYVNAAKYELGNLSAEDQEKNKVVLAALDVLTTYLGIYDTDDSGDIPFTEAAQGQYGGPLTPNYDRTADLYSLWDTTLKNAVSTFLASTEDPTGSFDVIYGKDWKKWAKLANSMRLKLAVRYIHQDLAKAKAIVSEVLASPAGIMDGLADDFAFKKADQNITSGGSIDAGNVPYNTGNGTITYNGQSASKPFVDFMIKNSDPRVRFLFTKNSWNSQIVNYYLKNGHKDQIPSFILANVETEVVDGVEQFKAWKGTGVYEGKGEPWVRYYGLPTDFNAATSTDPLLKEYYFYSSNKENGGNQITVDGTNYAFRPFSQFNEELVSGRVDFQPPFAPGDNVAVDNTDVPNFSMYLTTAEVNFYLAEFAIYGGVTGLSGTANDYFKKAVRYSVEAYNNIAAQNKIPYYGTTYSYDANELPIDLQEGEIDALLANPDYQLTGDKDSDLEKIFLNEIIHFAYQPLDEFVTARRSGVPKFNSNILKRVDYAADDMAADWYPRRTIINNPSPTDKMAEIITASMKAQGFTGNTTSNKELNKERVWQDEGAPQYGEGPNVK